MFLLEVSAGEHDLAVAAGMNVNCYHDLFIISSLLGKEHSRSLRQYHNQVVEGLFAVSY